MNQGNGVPEASLPTRRWLLRTGLASLAAPILAADSKMPFRLGVTDWNLYQGADPEAVVTAARLGFKGVQVSFGRKLKDNRMPVDDESVIARYLALSAQHGVTIDGTCVDRLHDNGLKSDPAASKWVLDSIRLTKALKTRVLLLPFFGKWALTTTAEKEHVGDLLRDLAPEAKKAGVILALEDTISAEDNVRIMDRSRADNVLVYYDVGNSTVAGFDVVKEIRWLGSKRICQMHLKDNPHYLGEGTIQFKQVVQAIRDIGFHGWANLETDVPEKDLTAGMKRNKAFIEEIMQSAG